MVQLSQVKWGAVCVTRCVLKQRRKRETCECTPSRVCTYYVTSNPTHPSYSRRHSDVPRRATLSCVWRVHMIRQRQCTRVYVQRRGWSRNVQARALLLQDIPDSPRGMAVWHQPRHLTWPPGWRVGLTLSEICVARYIFLLGDFVRAVGRNDICSPFFYAA